MKSIKLDYSKRCAGEPEKGHNRWHPAIPPILEVEPGEEVEMDTRDSTDGQLTPNSSAEDVLKIDRDMVHPLTGPIFVKGAHPGDVLEVEVLEVKPDTWGWTAVKPGVGSLRDVVFDPWLAVWTIKNGYAESQNLPGVRIPNGAFMGTIGVAPSQELLREATRREESARQRGGMVLTPTPVKAVPSQEPIASEGLRTMPPRENGGNMDVRQLSSGVKLLLPVFVEGALFSAGDGHFAQGDGEVCGTAIEMNTTLLVRFQVRKGQSLRFPRFEREDYYYPPELAVPKRFIATIGIPLRDGVNEAENATLAAQQALLNMIELLTERGWTREQAYVICSVAVSLKLNEIVCVPNPLVSAFLPLDIFVE